MIPNYPYFGLPNYIRYVSPPPPPPKPAQVPPPQKKKIVGPTKKENNTNKFSQEAQPLLNFLGISLYFDDVLLLCIIFFLYNEKVNDPYLFFSLVLLLLN